MAQLEDEEISDIIMYREPSLTYKIGEDVVSGKIDNIESVKQAVKHILSTERYSNPIYDDNYGVELEQYINSDIATITAGIQTTLSEALLQDDRITEVIVTDVKELENNSCLIEFDVYTIYGTYKEELNV